MKCCVVAQFSNISVRSRFYFVDSGGPEWLGKIHNCTSAFVGLFQATPHPDGHMKI
jgi:hypothetical protein